jgi:hypothetical protein
VNVIKIKIAYTKKLRTDKIREMSYRSFQNLWSYRLLSKNIEMKIYSNIIPLLISYRCVTGSLILREEYRLRVFDNRVLRNNYGPRREKVRRCWGKLHNA